MGYSKNRTLKLFAMSILCAVMVLSAVLCANTMNAFAASDNYVTVVSPDGYEEEYSLPSKQNDFKATKVNTSSVTLSWYNPYGSYPDGYEISKYNASTKKHTVIGTTKKLTYKVKNLKKGTKYTFKVRGYITLYGKKYYGPYTSALKTATSPGATSLKEVKYKSQGKITVKWKKVSNASGYIIQYSTSSKFPEKGGTCTKIVSGADNTSKTIGGFAKKTYYVRICAYKSNGGKKFMGKWSSSKKVTVKKGLSLKSMINYTKTDLSGRKTIKELTNNAVDIKKYDTTYDRVKAIFAWHAKHNTDYFSSCYACNSNFNRCISALYGDTKKYDTFLRIAAGDFKNSNGKKVEHKWTVMYVSGVAYIFDPRMQGYTGNSNGTTYFGVTSGSSLGKRYLFDYWAMTWNPYVDDYVIKYKE